MQLANSSIIGCECQHLVRRADALGATRQGIEWVNDDQSKTRTDSDRYQLCLDALEETRVQLPVLPSDDAVLPRLERLKRLNGVTLFGQLLLLLLDLDVLSGYQTIAVGHSLLAVPELTVAGGGILARSFAGAPLGEDQLQHGRIQHRRVNRMASQGKHRVCLMKLRPGEVTLGAGRIPLCLESHVTLGNHRILRPDHAEQRIGQPPALLRSTQAVAEGIAGRLGRLHVTLEERVVSAGVTVALDVHEDCRNEEDQPAAFAEYVLLHAKRIILHEAARRLKTGTSGRECPIPPALDADLVAHFVRFEVGPEDRMWPFIKGSRTMTADKFADTPSPVGVAETPQVVYTASFGGLDLTGKAAVLKTAGSNPIGVRVPGPPLDAETAVAVSDVVADWAVTSRASRAAACGRRHLGDCDAFGSVEQADAASEI